MNRLERALRRITLWARDRDDPLNWLWYTDFVGQRMLSNYWEYHQVGLLLKERGDIRGICEIGTGNGCLTMLLGLWAARLGVPVVSFDIDPDQSAEVWPVFRRLGVELRSEDVFGAEGRSAVRRFLEENSPAYLVCDGGDKPREFAEFAPVLGPGSVVSVHDWGVDISRREGRDTAAELDLRPWHRSRWMERNVQFATWTVPEDGRRRPPALLPGTRLSAPGRQPPAAEARLRAGAGDPAGRPSGTRRLVIYPE